jgi:phenylacetate-CoA ligase
MMSTRASDSSIQVLQDVSFLSPQAISALQNEKLVKQFELIAQYHSFYKERSQKIGLELSSINLSNLDDFPVTSKADLAENFDNFQLQLPDELSDPIWDIAYTSGSTSKPIPIYQTSRDFRTILLTQRRMAEIRGMNSEDRILNLYPLTQYPHGAWTRANHAAATLGAYVACGMSGSSDGEFGATRSLSEVAQLAARIEATVFWGVPSYVKKVLDQIKKENLTIPKLRMIAVSGEACSGQMKSSLIELAARIGADVQISNSLGASELQCGLVECKDGAGFHNPAPELFYFSVLDYAGKEVKEDTFGTLAVTHLDRRGTTLIKYLLGDQVRLTRAACPECGRAGGRIIAHQGRAGTLIKIRGQLVDRAVLERCVSEFPGVIDYMILISKENPLDGLSEDLINIEVATKDGEQSEEFVSILAAQIKKEINVSPKITLVEIENLHIENVSIKTTKFRDER